MPTRPLLALLIGTWALLLLVSCGGAGPPRGAPTPAARSATPHAAATESPSTPETSQGPWHVVALGDSVTSGAACNCSAFPQQYARDLAHARGVRVTVQNLGQSGQDSGGLLNQLRQHTSVQRAAVQRADIVVVTIGANDFSDHHDDVVAARCALNRQDSCVDREMHVLRRNMLVLLGTIHRVRAGRPTAVLVTGYWNVFQDGQVARNAFSAAGVRATRTLTFEADDVIQSATRQAGATFVGLYSPFHGPAARGDITNLLAGDGDHPNAAGQSLIAQRLLAAGLRGLVSG